MEKHIIYNGISYTLHGDYYFRACEKNSVKDENQGLL